MPASCCPSSAWPALKQDVSFVGKVEKFDGIEVYRTTGSVPADKVAKDRVIYHFYDIFGLRGGRSMKLCDTFADLFECEVIFIDGNVIDGEVKIMDHEKMDTVVEWLGTIPWAKMKSNYYTSMDKIEEAAGGCNRAIAITSTCWGSLVNFKVSGSDGSSHKWAKNIKCGVNYHPSVQVCGFEGEDPLEVASTVSCPQLLLPCKDDHEMYDGAILEKLPKGSKTENFRDMAHGFVSRGEMNYEVSGRFVKAMELTTAFFKENGFGK